MGDLSFIIYKKSINFETFIKKSLVLYLIINYKIKTIIIETNEKILKVISKNKELHFQ